MRTLDVVKVGTPNHILDDLRRICLSYPQACEKETLGHPTFRVRDKIFVGVGLGEPIDSDLSITVKSTAEERQALLAEGTPYYLPDYVGVHGWIGMKLADPVEWDVVSELIEESYRLVAPKKLVAALDK